ncbi:RapZ C-terminal domain-containing protein [Saccharopolyspora hattusasensis]|uniref:RapZ C-terminal domain-containing protein n=1 Tax=Saccharopolyspora hattusasensis TaxID=1128679 RepID=UPI003D968466
MCGVGLKTCSMSSVRWSAEKQGNPLVTVALGCQGGHDRSVAIALGLAEAFELAGTRSLIRHLSFVRGPR